VWTSRVGNDLHLLYRCNKPLPITIELLYCNISNTIYYDNIYIFIYIFIFIHVYTFIYLKKDIEFDITNHLV
jgi:hypothetical protein